MKAFIVDRYKKKGALRFGEMPEPELRDDDVLVQIHAAGLNLLDSKIRDGEFKLILPYRLPLILGNDAAVATTTSTHNVELVKSRGADVVVDYKKDDFAKVLNGYDAVLNSLGKDTLERSLSALKPGGKLVSISGPPDPDFARDNGSSWF